MKLYNMHFNRKFSTPLRRRLWLDVGEMRFEHDFIGDKRSDLYPVLHKSGNVTETVSGGIYTARSAAGGERARLIGEFFPYYTYSFKIGHISSAEVGLGLINGEFTLKALASDKGCRIEYLGREILKTAEGIKDRDTFSVTFRAGGVSLYRERDGKEKLLLDVSENEYASAITDIDGKGLEALLYENVYKKTDAVLLISLGEGGEARVGDVRVRLMSGIGTADVRPIKNADGTPLIDDGRVFLTASARLETGAYQCVLSWLPTTSEFKMEGALFFDTGDGMTANDVASTVIYDKERGKWYIWYCSFSHGHVLARAELDTDPRFGISIIDATPMEIKEGASLTDFVGFFGDEDPDLILIDGVWHLAICRSEPDGYHYYRFTSDNPLEGFTFRDRTEGAEKTGGSFINLNGEYYFTCGSDFRKRAIYDVYEQNDFSTPHRLPHRHDDGGFRGWGSVFAYPVGTRKRIFHITFDRFLTSKKWNWSYGNLYVFEAEEYLK